MMSSLAKTWKSWKSWCGKLGVFAILSNRIDRPCWEESPWMIGQTQNLSFQLGIPLYSHCGCSLPRKMLPFSVCLGQHGSPKFVQPMLCTCTRWGPTSLPLHDMICYANIPHITASTTIPWYEASVYQIIAATVPTVVLPASPSHRSRIGRIIPLNNWFVSGVITQLSQWW